MMSGPRLEHVRAVRAANAARRTCHDRRALVVRLIGQDAFVETGFARRPRALEFLAVALGAVALEEFAVPADAPSDEMLAGLLENRAPLLAVGIEQRLAAPSLQHGRQFPSQVPHVLQAVVEAEPAIGRMAVRGIASDEGPPDPVGLGDSDAQVPESDMIERAGERETSGFLDEAMKVVIVGPRIRLHGRVEEPALADVDAAEELPVAFVRRVERIVGGTLGKPLEALVQLARTENGEHHQLVEVRPAAPDADLLAYRGAAAVAAHHVIGLEDLPPTAALLDDGDAHAARILLDRLRRPAEMTFNAGQPGHFPAQHLFHQILRKPLI